MINGECDCNFFDASFHFHTVFDDSSFPQSPSYAPFSPSIFTLNPNQWDIFFQYAIKKSPIMARYLHFKVI